MRWRVLALAVSICVLFPRVALCDAGTESGFEAAFAEYSDTMSHEGYYRPGDERRSAVHELIDKAPDGSVVTVAPGEYVSNYFALTGRHNLTIRAKPGTVWLVSDDPLAGDWAPPDQPRLYDEYRYYYHKEEPIRCLHKHFEGNYEGGGEKTVAGMPNEELDCADSEATAKREEARAFLKAFRAGTVSEDYLECR